MLYDPYIPNHFFSVRSRRKSVELLNHATCIPQHRPYFSTFLNSIALMAPMFEGVLVFPFGAPDVKIN